MKAEKPIRAKIMRVSPAMLFYLLTEKEIHRELLTEIPDDLKLVGCFMRDYENGAICLVVESESFEPVPFGKMIPDFGRLTYKTLMVPDFDNL